MKSTVRVLLLVMLTASLTSCEKIKSLFDIEVETTISGNLDIEVDETELKSTDGFGFNESITVQVLNDDLYEYEDEIEDFVVSGVTAEVDFVSEDGVEFLEGTIFTISNTTYTVQWILDSDWPIEVGTSFNLVDAGLYDMVEDILDDRMPFTMSAVGESSIGGVTVVIRLGIETTVTVNPT
ncbi:MAG: hypothetical protein KAS82_01500 [Bacteroidales bacterium]|nr:hypothetical protein [Bacteroidales bacterium]